MLCYLEAKEDEIKKIIINGECCDNCSRVLNDGTSLHLIYEGMNEDSSIDLSDELRLLLLSINTTKMKISESIDLLLGEIPHSIQNCELATFGMGKKKEKGWWQGLVFLIVGNHLILTEDIAFVTNKGKSFLRNKMKQAVLQPNLMMRKFMKKRDDIDLFWEGNVVKSRPKQNQICKVPNNNMSSQDLIVIQDTLNFDLSEFDVCFDHFQCENSDTIQQTLEGLEEEFLKEMSYGDDNTEPPCKIQKLI